MNSNNNRRNQKKGWNSHIQHFAGVIGSFWVWMIASRETDNLIQVVLKWTWWRQFTLKQTRRSKANKEIFAGHCVFISNCMRISEKAFFPLKIYLKKVRTHFFSKKETFWKKGFDWLRIFSSYSRVRQWSTSTVWDCCCPRWKNSRRSPPRRFVPSPGRPEYCLCWCWARCLERIPCLCRQIALRQPDSKTRSQIRCCNRPGPQTLSKEEIHIDEYKHGFAVPWNQ